MHHFSGLLADYMDAQEPFVRAVKQQLYKADMIADDLSSGRLVVTTSSNDVGHLFCSERFFGFADEAYLRNRIDSGRQKRSETAGVD